MKTFTKIFVGAALLAIVSVASASAAYMHTVTLKFGSRGTQVSELQMALNVTPATGYFGSKTKAAVMAFQAANGLKADGVVGPMTGAKIGVSAIVLCLGLSACERDVILQGERFDLRTPLQASLVVEGQPAPTAPAGVENRAVPIAVPAARSFADWTHRGGSTQHTAGNGQLSVVPQKIWSDCIKCVKFPDCDEIALSISL